MTFFFWFASTHNESGLRIANVLTFSAKTATFLYTILAAIFGTLVIFLIALFIRWLQVSPMVKLTSTSLIKPKVWWSNQLVILPLRDVIGFEIYEMVGDRFLKISHAGGSLSLRQSLFESSSQFERFCEQFEETLGGAPNLRAVDKFN